VLIDPSCPLASWFLLGGGAFFGAAFALPLLFAPLHWARRFGWRVPEDASLTVYFGRCLGAVAVAVVVQVLRAAPDPRGHRGAFELLVTAGVPLALVHVWGAVRRAQPWIETAEIGLYAGVSAIAVWFLHTL
jgi:hypothetical protein